jgi:hypothetical protein
MPQGFGERIKSYHLIGHGSYYARTISKYLFPVSENGEIHLKCEEIIPRLASCIYWISDGIDDLVGGRPQIMYILDNDKEIKEGKYDEDAIKKGVEKIKHFLQRIDFKKE